MELIALHKRVIGLDIHQAQITACAIIDHDDGTHDIQRRQFGTFKRDQRALAEWAAALCPELVVMESTGIYWKSPYAALEAAGLRLLVVNARHVKNVPVARPTSAMRNGWPRWRVPGCCAGRSSRRPHCASCA
jgi:transposase